MATAISGLRKARASRALAEASGQALLAALAHAEFLPQDTRIERVLHEAT